MHEHSETPETIFLVNKDIHSELHTFVVKLRKIKQPYERVVGELRSEFGIRNRGCGPSSYGLAVLMQGEAQLPLSASLLVAPKKENGICVIFGEHEEFEGWVDHAWVEVTFNDQTLVISPTSSSYRENASFSAGVVLANNLATLYRYAGLRRIECLEDISNLTNTEKHAARDIVDSINSGEAPDMYLQWFQYMMSELSE